MLGRPLASTAMPTRTTRRSRRACSTRITRRGRSCGLNAESAERGEALLAFGKPASSTGRALNLSPRGDLVEAAANLFSHLRALDASGAQRIAVMTIPHEGLGEAINDRLARAAAPKS